MLNKFFGGIKDIWFCTKYFAKFAWKHMFLNISFNKRNVFVVIGNSSGYCLCCSLTFRCIRHEHYGDDFDVLFGPAYKGIPLSVTTAIAYSELYGKEVRYCSNRKEVKDHGDTGILLGSKIKDGDKVVIIEDVTTSGKSIEETFPIIKAQGDVEIKGLIVSLNRMERGLSTDASALDEIQSKYGFGANAIVTMEDVVECLYNKECQGKVLIDDKLKAAIDKYYEQYGVKN